VKFQCDQETLSNVVSTVLNVVPARTTLPVVSHLLLEVRENMLMLTATDLDLWLSTRVDVTGVGGGTVTVPGRTFAEMVRELPPGEVRLEAEGSKVTLLTERGTFSVMGTDADEFPKFPALGEGVAFSVPGATLHSMIDRTAFAASTDETRPALCGVRWSITAASTTMVATDGFRLARTEHKLKNGPPEDAFSEAGGKLDAIVPPGALQQVMRLAGNGTEVRVTLAEGFVQFEMGESVMVSRVIGGPYPSLEEVIPKANPKHLVVAREALEPAIRRAHVLSSNQSRQVKLTLRESEAILEAESEEFGGRAFETVAVEYDGEPLDILYNAEYLAEVLSKMGAGDVRFELDTSVTASVIRPQAPDAEEDYLCLLMPLRPLEG
jgi:DNA polymerase-3 subunit beta